ncbi:hypothetical protein J3R30DRAFT_3404445 [Lentinula aciculospora]|uniref:acireductone dioxygenase (Fe(2+)-requiring) n=1 Tax=Lentinula aciculospora TaxID=153920 RepID=A0A9W9AAQ4_9AGAR|nr:hypothetical protein J3R30DRAFT_3404445 [Lentinula aciculospora]
MPLHAYHHDNKGGDPSHPHHSSHSVPIEYLGALGITISAIEGPDFEANARTIAKEQGYPLTENTTFMLDFHDHNESSPFIGEASLNESEFKKFIVIPDYLVVITAGSFYFDVEDHIKKAWIRSELPVGTMLHIPAGVSRRLAPLGSGAKGLMFVKEKSEIQVIWDQEAEEHPVRQEYLKSFAFERWLLVKQIHSQIDSRRRKLVKGVTMREGCDGKIGSKTVGIVAQKYTKKASGRF